jgi:hypothetical protein
MDPWCTTGRLTKKIQENSQLSEDQVANQHCSNENVLLERASTRPRVFLYSSQNFHQQREVFVHQERTPTDLRLKEQGGYEYTSRSSAATTPDTVLFMLECRNSLKQNSEPCSKAKVPRTKIAATSTPPKSYLQLQESSKRQTK